MSRTMLPVTQNHIPEDLKRQQRCCGNLGATFFQFTVTGYESFEPFGLELLMDIRV